MSIVDHPGQAAAQRPGETASVHRCQHEQTLDGGVVAHGFFLERELQSMACAAIVGAALGSAHHQVGCSQKIQGMVSDSAACWVPAELCA